MGIAFVLFYLSSKAGDSAPCVLAALISPMARRVFLRHYAIRGGPKRIRRVVVVGVACRVHIPRIIRVAAIRRPQTDVLSTAYTPDVNRLFTFRL